MGAAGSPFQGGGLPISAPCRLLVLLSGLIAWYIWLGSNACADSSGRTQTRCWNGERGGHIWSSMASSIVQEVVAVMAAIVAAVETEEEEEEEEEGLE